MCTLLDRPFQKCIQVVSLFVIFFALWVFTTSLFYLKFNSSVKEFEAKVLDSNYTGKEICGDLGCFGTDLCLEYMKIKDKSFKFRIIPLSLTRESGFIKAQGKIYSSEIKGKIYDFMLLSDQTQPTKPSSRASNLFNQCRIESELCKQFKVDKCDVRGVIRLWFEYNLPHKGRLDAKTLKNLNPAFRCASDRLGDTILMRSSPPKSSILLEHYTLKEQMNLYLTALIYPRTIIQKTFSAEEGWSVPSHLGSCNLAFVQESTKYFKNMSYIFNQSWKLRVDIAIQFLEMAHKYTENKDKIHLMMHKTSTEDYMVSNTMKLMAIKPEKLIPFDVEKTPFVSTSYEAATKLKGCELGSTDINYLFVCKNILVGKWWGKDKIQLEEGLLHDPEILEADKIELRNLLHLCINGAGSSLNEIESSTIKSRVRQTAALQALHLLMKFRECNSLYAYRYPECLLKQSHKKVVQITKSPH